MTEHLSAGSRFRVAVDQERPLQIAGTINACCARLAEQAGFRAIYLSGAGVANASIGLPDLGYTTLENVVEDARRITAISTLPLLVDADTGWESSATIPVTVKRLVDAGAAALHLEDQHEMKRCGHRPGKRLVTTDQMCDRLKAAVDARQDPGFVIVARTDAAANEGLSAAIDRAGRYVDAGADMIFAEALTEASAFQRFATDCRVPVLANMTEFGRSPLMSAPQLGDLGIRLVLYPLSAFRAMNAAAAHVYQTLRQQQIQTSLLDTMQTREQLYELLDYHVHEQAIDETFLEREEDRS